jgi:hypothetical protein
MRCQTTLETPEMLRNHIRQVSKRQQMEQFGMSQSTGYGSKKRKHAMPAGEFSHASLKKHGDM